MIDFRYHLVSIVAVFLALAIGIVLGSTELQGPVYNALSHTTSTLDQKLSIANGQRDAAQQEVAADTAWFSANESSSVRGMLAGQRVLIVTEPDYQSSVVSGITSAVQDAGGTITGTLGLQQKFFDSSNATLAALDETNTQLAQSTGVQLDSGMANQQQATAQLLASMLLTSPGDTSNQTGSTSATPDTQTALNAYSQQGFLTMNPATAPKATLAVVVTTQNVPPQGTNDPLSQLLGPVVQELAGTTHQAVVAGSAAGSGAGSPISVLRSTSVGNMASSVDDADTVVGQISVIASLHDQLTGGKVSDWGRNTGGGPVYPAVSPSASGSAPATATASPGSGKKKK